MSVGNQVGKRLVELREEKGWTTNRLANLCGLSQSFIRSVELNEKGISVENLSVICDTLGITLSRFFASIEKKGQIDFESDVAQLNSEQKNAICRLIKTFKQ